MDGSVRITTKKKISLPQMFLAKSGQQMKIGKQGNSHHHHHHRLHLPPYHYQQHRLLQRIPKRNTTAENLPKHSKQIETMVNNVHDTKNQLEQSFKY